MSVGWIKVSRKIGDNWLWDKRPFSYGHAWIDLLLLANHKDGFFFVRDIMVEIKRGQVGHSILTLSKKWGWSRTAVETFLNRLEIAQQITQQRMKLTTLITIINYDTYQETEQQITQQESNRKATEEQQQSINKNDKNDKKKSNNFVPPSIEDVTAYCLERNNGVNPSKWMNHYQSKGWMVGRTKMKDWRAAVRTWEGDRKVLAAKNNTRLDRNIEAARQAGMMLGVFDEEA